MTRNFRICATSGHLLSSAFHSIGLLLGLGLCFSVMAQTSPSQERDIATRYLQESLRQQQQEQQQRQQLERLPDVRLSTPEDASRPKLPIEKPCFDLRHLELKNTSGTAVPEFDWLLEQLVAPGEPVFMDQCVGARGVAWIIDRGQKILVDHGFVTTRLLVTQQDMSQGTLVLTLVAGRIHAIRLSTPVDPRANLPQCLANASGRHPQSTRY